MLALAIPVKVCAHWVKDVINEVADSATTLSRESILVAIKQFSSIFLFEKGVEIMKVVNSKELYQLIVEGKVRNEVDNVQLQRLYYLSTLL